ncbi:benzoate 4-monooxygenase cytochrome P450 [Annulohypoxylon truncatum]|uniref:benzoate 4-monooxygenase cytochrome P450 n=1 Tax=Annulohypoxylon truncatum TaxID=327061 RepID=UPI0020077E25|nr:benzoate 4-monooxygenase cytochrome P450 [Annulohypoxylon truncatum]KAI1208163.1 benzoate 4-monooxygenase cytochrome P450 [Annulohypoxylon truncatum]
MAYLVLIVEVAVFTVVCTILVCTYVAIRRILFHPYSKIPGPFFAKVTNVYSAYHSWRGTMHLDVQICHQKYGDLIRYGPNQILTLYPPDMNAIYGHGKPFRKSKGYETMIPIPDGWSTMTSIDKTLHHNLRRVLRSGLTTESLARYEPAILRNLKIYFSQLTQERDGEGWSSTGDMRKWNLCLGFDTMAEFGLGLKTNLLSGPARDFVFPALHVHEKKMGLWEQLPILNDLGIGNLVSITFLLFSPRAKLFANWYQTFLEEAIATNTAKSSGIFGPPIQSGQGLLEKPGHNYAQMIGEGSFSTFSSADAYGIMISGFLHYLTQYPHVYEKLAVELRSKFRPGEEITWGPKLESSAYLRAVIDEVMRLLPPACGVHWRECERSGVTIGPDELSMPVGSDVGMSLFALFRDGRIFRKPVLFWPERWIPGTLPEAEYSLAKKMFTPFSVGPRNCAGGHVAIMMTSIAYTYILVNYEFRYDPEQEKATSSLWPNSSKEPGTQSELRFESHYSIAGWESGPFIQFQERK